jgi:putative Mn2+ efflux pump MntP
MQVWIDLVFQSIALGVALAMDAFSVSMANGLSEPDMSKKRMCTIAGTFAGFQFAMPMIGWFCVTRIKEIFQVFEQFIPWIALVLLVLIGGKMLLDGVRENEEEQEAELSGDPGSRLGAKMLFVQGVATSIDALSTGFTTSAYHVFQAFVSSLIIAIVTFWICIYGVKLGKKFGLKLAGGAQILGGVILILIGLKICFIG